MPRCSRRVTAAGGFSAPSDWVPPLQDPWLEAELRAATKESLGAEVEAEAALVDALQAQGSSSSSSTEVGSLLAVPLAALARAVDSAGGNALSVAATAATCSRLFCACHVVRAASAARRLERLDRALRFRGHPDFRPALVELDDSVLVDLEAAGDLFELEASQLRALMAQRGPGRPAQEAARALYTLLVDGRPTHPVLTRYSGLWGSDRMVLEPSIMLPLLFNRNPQEASADAFSELRSRLCQLREQVAPAVVLSSAAAEKGQSVAAAAAAAAAAAVLQWAWLQMALRELREPPLPGSSSQVGMLEGLLLLQPSQAQVKLERRRAVALKALQRLRSDALLARLAGSWHLRRGSAPPVKRQLVMAGSQPGPPPMAPVQARPRCQAVANGCEGSGSGGSSKPRRSFGSDGLRGQASLPVLPKRAGAGQPPSPASSLGGRRDPEEADLLAGDFQVRSTSSTAAWTTSEPSRRSHGSLLGASSPTNGSQGSLRKVLGLHQTAAGPVAGRERGGRDAGAEGSHSRSRSSGAGPVLVAAAAASRRAAGAGEQQRRPSAGQRPQSSAERRTVLQAASTTEACMGVAKVDASFGRLAQPRLCAWAFQQPAEPARARPFSAPGGLPWAPAGIPWVTPMR